MCGISAIFASKESVDLSSIVKMNHVIRHRGPDDEGAAFFLSEWDLPKIFGGDDTPQEVLDASLRYCPREKLSIGKPFIGEAALGHRRLAILDLSCRGHQPFCNREGSLWLTYNGEIYNYLEIKRQLEGLGYHFDTATDTEVLLTAYEEWGEACLERLNGMFAFVIYDRKRKAVFAARDRFGVKPLYYWRSPAGFVAFASEIKQFTQLSGWRARLNRQRAHDFLQWAIFDHTEETLFEGVFQLRGGECLSYSIGSNALPVKHRWYHLQGKRFQGTMEDASTQFFELLEDAVRLRIRADVDVGSCLSGGLDSSSIVCLSNRLLREGNCQGRQKAFSACSDVARFNERNYIDLVVNHTEVEAHYTYPQAENLLEECRQIVWHQDEPFCSTSIYAQWQVFKMAGAQGLKVMLDGQGADEQLGGYHGFFGNRFYELFQSGQWRKLCREMRASKAMHSGLRPLALLSGRILPHWLRDPVKKIALNRAGEYMWVDGQYLDVDVRHPLRRNPSNSFYDQSFQQLLFSSVPMLLHYEDRDSMAHAVESRTPFLDYRLVEFNLGLPSEMKVSGGWTKHVMRAAMKGTLPEEIRMRVDKIGFATAEEEWMRHRPLQFAAGLKEAVEVSEGVIREDALHLFEQMVEGRIAFDFTPWRMISFGQWAKCFDVSM